MTRKNKSKKYVPQGNGEEIRVLVAEPADAMDAVLQFLALLAYPVDSEKEKREPFAKAVHAALYKSRVWNERGNKHDGVAFRTRIPVEYRRLSNRGIDGVVRRGLGRLNHRIMAGNVALRFLFEGMVIPRSAPARPLKLVAPTTLRAAFLDVVKLKQQKERVHLNEDDAVENFRKQIWAPSLSVLHLACVLYLETCRLPDAPTDILETESGPAWEGAQFIWELTSGPTWIADALVRAEGYRSLLSDRIPQHNFNPRKAVRLLPS